MVESLPRSPEYWHGPPRRDVGQRRSRVETIVRQTFERKEKTRIQGGRSGASQQDSSYV